MNVDVVQYTSTVQWSAEQCQHTVLVILISPVQVAREIAATSDRKPTIQLSLVLLPPPVML